MAIFLKGLTKCPLCGKIIDDDNFIMFPPFISNLNDKLAVFNDQTIHISCLNKHPLREEAIYFRQKYERKNRENKEKVIQLNRNPRDFVFVPILTSDKEEKLYSFNFCLIDIQDIEGLPDHQILLSELKKFLLGNKWKSLSSDFNLLSYLIQKLS